MDIFLAFSMDEINLYFYNFMTRPSWRRRSEVKRGNERWADVEVTEDQRDTLKLHGQIYPPLAMICNLRSSSPASCCNFGPCLHRSSSSSRFDVREQTKARTDQVRREAAGPVCRRHQLREAAGGDLRRRLHLRGGRRGVPREGHRLSGGVRPKPVEGVQVHQPPGRKGHPSRDGDKFDHHSSSRFDVLGGKNRSSHRRGERVVRQEMDNFATSSQKLFWLKEI